VPTAEDGGEIETQEVVNSSVRILVASRLAPPFLSFVQIAQF
jgi:hypothetical protein